MATFNSPNVSVKTFEGKLNQVARAKTSNLNKPLGVFEFDSGVITLPTTAMQEDDVIYAYTFPANCRLIDLTYTTTDRDTNVSPALVEDITLTNSAGTVVVLIADTDVAQAGGSVSIPAASKHIDCSNQKLGILVEASSATAAAGTIRFRGLIGVGKAGYGLISSPASTAV